MHGLIIKTQMGRQWDDTVLKSHHHQTIR